MYQNNSMSFDDKNEFMSNSQKSPADMQEFMKNIYQSPEFFQSMKQFCIAKMEGGQPQGAPIKNLNSNVRNGQQMHPTGSQNKSRDRKQERQQFEPHFQEEQVVLSKPREVKRKPANPLQKFMPPSQDPKPQPPEPPAKPHQKKNNFDDIPIKSTFTESMSKTSNNFDLNSLKENKSLNFQGENPSKTYNLDDIPIRGVKQHQLDSYYNEQKDENKFKDSSVNFDERPLTGCAKDFKQMVREQFPNAIIKDEEYEERGEEEKQTEPRNFLKRGSRSHLSSAANRSKQPKDKDKGKDKSFVKDQISEQRPTTPRKNQQAQGRSTSQNRVLSKKNNTNSQKALPKAVISKNDESFDQGYHRVKPPLNKQTKPQPQSVKAVNVDSKPTYPIHSNKNSTTKGKNIFKDESDQSSDSSEQNAPYFKATKKQTQSYGSKPTKIETSDLIEIIDGVFVTQDQLDQISVKYGRVKEVKKETESEKLAALRKKYSQMAALLEEESEQNRMALEKEREEFERYKVEQSNKIKSDRRIMERQVKGTASNHNSQKDKQQLEHLKQEVDKQREDFKRRDKNSRIMLDKYKKENQQLRCKLQRVEIDMQKTLKSSKDDTFSDNKSISKSVKDYKPKKLQEESKVQQVSYRDIKKGAKIQQKQTKPKYQFVEEDQPIYKSTNTKTDTGPQRHNKWQPSDSDSQPEDIEDNQDFNQSQVVPSFRPINFKSLGELAKTKNLSIKMISDSTIDELFRYKNNPEYRHYHNLTQQAGRTVVNTSRNARNQYTAKLYSDRSKQLHYDNGTRKVALQNGYSIVYFKNGDIKQSLPDKTVMYYFKEKEVDQITLPNSINIYRFQNNQVELHYQNNYIEIRHPDGTIKVLGGEPLRR